MTGEGAETIGKPAHLADPVDVPVAVHQDRPPGQRLQAAHEPVAVDQRRADALGERLGRPGIFHDVVMQRDDPAGARIGRRSAISMPRICSADTMPSALVKEKCVSAFELSRMMPSPSSLSGGTIMGKTLRPELGDRIGEERLGLVGEAHHLAAMRLQQLRERAAEAAVAQVDHADAAALHRVHGGQASNLAQAPVGARRQVHARRVGAIDDVEVVIAGKHQHALGEARMRRHGVEQLGPFGWRCRRRSCRR